MGTLGCAEWYSSATVCQNALPGSTFALCHHTSFCGADPAPDPLVAAGVLFPHPAAANMSAIAPLSSRFDRRKPVIFLTSLLLPVGRWSVQTELPRVHRSC